MNNKILLASTSKYRAQLLAQLKVPFEAHAPINVNEEEFKNKGLQPVELAQKLALLKAQSLVSKFSHHLIIGSDQVIALEGEIFGKPGSKEKAILQLKKFRGKTHQLITAVAMIKSTELITFEESAELAVRSDLTDEEIQRYVDLDNPIDCAGSYKLESLGPSLFESIQCRDHSSITGLPLIKTAFYLRQLGTLCP